jgi:hypothetical protein
MNQTKGIAPGYGLEQLEHAPRKDCRDSVGGAGKHLEILHPGTPEFLHPREIFRPQMGGQSKVNQRPIPCMGPFLLEKGKTAHRVAVGVLDHGGDATDGGRSRTGDKILTLTITGILKVNMPVDHSRQDEQAGGIAALPGRVAIGCYIGYHSVPDVEVLSCLAAAADQHAPFDSKIIVHSSIQA